MPHKTTKPISRKKLKQLISEFILRKKNQIKDDFFEFEYNGIDISVTVAPEKYMAETSDRRRTVIEFTNEEIGLK